MGSARVAAALFAVALLTRIPFQTEHLWAWDSVLYARAMDDFDPTAHRPQPPGYLYYIVLARGLAALVGDANRALTLISAVAGAASVALLYLLARRLYDERTARVAAVFLATSVTFWAYSSVAYPYTLLCTLSLAVALLLWRAMERRDARSLLLASAAWGVAIGFRSDLAIFLAPLWLLAASAVGPRAAVGSAATAAVLVALWFGASAAAVGDLAGYVAAIREQSQYILRAHSVIAGGADALWNNAYEIARFAGRALHALALPLLVLFIVPRGFATEASQRAALFLTLWIATPLAMYLLLHAGDYGYAFSFLPALCILAARGAVAFAGPIRRTDSQMVLRRATAAVVLTNAAIFLLTDTPLSAGDLARRDAGIAEKVAYVKSLADREVVVVSAYDALVAEHYLGDGRYAMVRLDAVDRPAAHGHGSCTGTMTCTVVVWDEILRADGEQWETVQFPSGSRLRIAHGAHAWIATEELHVRLELPDVAERARRGRRGR
jgi:uncharacterized membrane protein